MLGDSVSMSIDPVTWKALVEGVRLTASLVWLPRLLETHAKQHLLFKIHIQRSLQRLRPSKTSAAPSGVLMTPQVCSWATTGAVAERIVTVHLATNINAMDVCFLSSAAT